MKRLILILIFFPFLLQAQIQVSTSLSYVTEPSFGEDGAYTGSGIDISLRKHLTEKWKLTAYSGINKMRVTLAVQSRFDYSTKIYGYYYKDVVPVSFGAEYYIWNKKFIKPFVGLETGTYFTSYQTQIDPNYLSFAKNIPAGSSINWGFSPSLGIQFQENADRLGLFLKVKHTGIVYGNTGLSNMLSFSAGFTFKFGRKIMWRPPVIEVPTQAPYYETKDLY
ncbi:hypothetical protein ABID42_002690 [Arcicella rosea]|uniref:hypothetical protein n=1 Tax=Arcicella rosea TaxID=502909 RepID=UPI00345D89E3